MLSPGKVLQRSEIKAKKEQEVEEQRKNADRRELTTGNVIFCLVSCLVNIYEATGGIKERRWKEHNIVFWATLFLSEFNKDLVWNL